MACISKLSGGFAYDCDTGRTGLNNAIIFNFEDIQSYTLDAKTSLVTDINLTGSAKFYKIDTPKRTLILTDALKTNESAPNALSFTAVLTVTALNDNVLRTYVSLGAPNGRYVIFTKDLSGLCRIYGLYYGLSVTGYDRSSHDNGGWLTLTMSTPEQVIGEDDIQVTAALYDICYTAAVY